MTLNELIFSYHVIVRTLWLFLVSYLPRSIQSFVAIAQTGHIVTEEYLHRFNLTDSPISKQKWKGGQSGTYLRLTGDCPARGWASLRHIEMNWNENKYFGQITVAFLSSIREGGQSVTYLDSMVCVIGANREFILRKRRRIFRLNTVTFFSSRVEMTDKKL